MPRIVGKGEPQRVTEPPRFRRHTDGELRATLMGRLVTVSDLLRTTASVESAAAAIGRAALMLTGASRGAIFLRLPNGVVTCPWSNNLSDEYISRLCTPADANPWAHLSHYPELACMDLSARGRARSVAPSIVEDVRTLPGGNEMRRAAEREGLRSLFSWPVGRKGRVFAAITYYFDVPHACTDPEREVALAFTLQAGATLEQAMVGDKRPHAPARGGFFGGIVFGKRHIDRVPKPHVELPAAAADEQLAPRAPEPEAAEPEPQAPAALEAGMANDADADGDVEAESDAETNAARIAALQRALETEAGRLWSERTNLGVEREQIAVTRRELDTERERLAEMRRALDADQGRLAEMQNALAAESARSTKARGELEAEQARMSVLRQSLEAERQQVEGARRAIEAERDKAAALRRDTDAAVAQLAETRRVIDAEMAQLAASRGELEAERGRLATLQAELKAREAQLEEVRRDLDAERAAAVAELERERSEFLNAQGHFTAAQAEMAQQRTALEEESARLAQMRRDVDADRDRLAALVRSLEVGGPPVVDVAAEAAAAAAGTETDAPPAPPREVGIHAPHREVGMVPPPEPAPSTVQAVAPWTPAEAAQPVEMSKAVGPAQASIPVQTKPVPAKPAAAKAAPAVKPAPALKPASKPAPSKPGPAPKPARHAPSEPQPVPAPVDPATAQKYRERIAQWALAAARALASKEQDAADLRAAAMLYEVETGDGAAPTPAVAAILSNVQEQWNGKGGPQGLSGQDIPLGARILAVTVAYAEMVIGRPGSPMLYYLDAKAALKRNAGSKYDPDVVKAFCRVVNRA